MCTGGRCPSTQVGVQTDTQTYKLYRDIVEDNYMAGIEEPRGNSRDGTSPDRGDVQEWGSGDGPERGRGVLEGR